MSADGGPPSCPAGTSAINGTARYLADGLGSTMKTVDSSGVVVSEYEYDVYGTLSSSSGNQDNEFQFAGQQTDPTGLQYLRARYYDMETGRFISRDPMAASAAWMESPFVYASANAINLSDPLGLCSKFKPWQCGDEALQLAKRAGQEGLDYGREWVSDPVNQYSIAQAASMAAAMAACPTAVVGGITAPACVAAIGLYGTATKLKWDEIVERAESDEWGPLRRICTVVGMVPLPVPNPVGLACGLLGPVDERLFSDAPRNALSDEPRNALGDLPTLGEKLR
jgi:RHS repeat-associated protein